MTDVETVVKDIMAGEPASLERSRALDPDARTSALTVAARSARPDWVRTLVDAGADVHGRPSLDRTALHSAGLIGPGGATSHLAAEIAEILLAAGADPLAPTSPQGTLGRTPLEWAGSHGTPEFLRALLTDARTREPAPLRAAMDAACGGYEPLAKIELLVAAGADPNGDHALAHACRRNDPQVALRLLELGARVQVADEAGLTPLHVAVAATSDSVVEALVARGADPEIALKKGDRELDLRKGETPREVAIRSARACQAAATENILREFGVHARQVARFCAKQLPTEEGAWQAASAYAASIGDQSAANRASEPSCRPALDPARSSLPRLRRAARILELLDVDMPALLRPVFQTGTWTLAVVATQDGPVRSLKKWLAGKEPYTLEIGDDGRFAGALRRRKLSGTWQMEPDLALHDAKLGVLETELHMEGLDIIEWKNDDEASFLRYTFAPSRKTTKK